jgi:hypothetical protein
MAPEQEPGLSRSDRLRLDYQQTTDLLRGLTDVRFKLLALVPTISGAAIAVLGHPSSAAQLLAIGLLGLVATLGLLLYELRNSQLSDYAARRAQAIEAELGLLSLAGDSSPGGLFSERPGRSLRLFGLTLIDRDRGLVLVYSSACRLELPDRLGSPARPQPRPGAAARRSDRRRGRPGPGRRTGPHPRPPTASRRRAAKPPSEAKRATGLARAEQLAAEFLQQRVGRD